MAKIAGSIWIEGSELHYIDQFSREWFTIGIPLKVAPVGAKAGSLYYLDDGGGRLAYVDQFGANIYVTHAIGIGVLPVSSRIGSIWIHQDNLLHWIHRGTGGNIQAVNHLDVFTNTHQDSHVDSLHTDVPHSDVAHADGPHNDTHQDNPFSDHGDYGHGDFNDAPIQHSDVLEQHHTWPDYDYVYWTQTKNTVYHNDYSDKYVTPPTHADAFANHHDEVSAFQNPVYQSLHEDYLSHLDTPHGDAPHNDTHQDSHYDNPHYDAHTDSNHSDVGHNDVDHIDTPHTDIHNDAHGDVPHGDEPIYVGP